MTKRLYVSDKQFLIFFYKKNATIFLKLHLISVNNLEYENNINHYWDIISSKLFIITF